MSTPFSNDRVVFSGKVPTAVLDTVNRGGGVIVGSAAEATICVATEKMANLPSVIVEECRLAIEKLFSDETHHNVVREIYQHQ